MDRFYIYERLKLNINAVDDLDLRKRLNCMISPLYLYAIQCVEGVTEKKFKELTNSQKLMVFPGRIFSKISTCSYILRTLKLQTIMNNANFNARIVFYPVEPTHIRQMLPISNQLINDDFIYITDRLKIYSLLKGLGVKCLYIPVRQNRNSINFDYSRLGESIIPSEMVDKWVTFCKYQIETRYTQLEDSISLVLNRIMPTKCIVGYDITPEGRIAVEICKSLKIKSICIQHGSVAGEPLDGEHIVNFFLLWGEKAKDYLERFGNNYSSLIVFGAPYLDRQVSGCDNEKAILQKIGLNQKKKLIMVALSGPGHCTTMVHFNEIVRSIVHFAKNNLEIGLLFKLHRKDSIHNYKKIFKEEGFSCPLIDSTDKRLPTDILYWLEIVDLLITGSSTVALESMLKSKPVITIDYQNQYKNIDFIELGCTYHITQKEQLSDVILNVLSLIEFGEIDSIQLNAKQFIDSYFYKEVTTASQRIASWLLDVK